MTAHDWFYLILLVFFIGVLILVRSVASQLLQMHRRIEVLEDENKILMRPIVERGNRIGARKSVVVPMRRSS